LAEKERSFRDDQGPFIGTPKKKEISSTTAHGRVVICFNSGKVGGVGLEIGESSKPRTTLPSWSKRGGSSLWKRNGARKNRRTVTSITVNERCTAGVV